jgi:PAS domain S-box-containing protein
MDINLGKGIDGTEAAESILKEKEIPVVFMSSHTELDVVKKKEKITSYGYVVKNSGITVLDASIKMAFKLYAAHLKIKKDSTVINERNQLLENVLEQFPGRVFWKDRHLVYQGCNKNEAKRIGLASTNEIIGKTDYDMPWNDTEFEIYRKDDHTVLETGKPILHVEQFHYDFDGQKIWEDGNKVPLYDTMGDISGVLGVSLDITTRKQVEENLHNKTAFLETIVNSSIEGILVVDNHEKKILQNQRAIDLWKIPSNIAKNSDDQQQVHYVKNFTKNPEQFEKQVEYLYKHPDETSRDTIELKNGTILDRYSAPVRGGNGQNYGRIWTFHDITELQKNEKKVKELLAEKEILLKRVQYRIETK